MVSIRLGEWVLGVEFINYEDFLWDRIQNSYGIVLSKFLPPIKHLPQRERLLEQKGLNYLGGRGERIGDVEFL
jgi:hypothetical protein